MRRLVNRESNHEENELDEDPEEIDARQGMSAYHTDVGISPRRRERFPHATTSMTTGTR